jgi:hypothetical protein
MFRHLASATLVFFLLVATLSVFGQTAQISGEVWDPLDSVVPNVRIRVVNQATLVERHATTNDAGLYVLPLLYPGIYQVIIEGAGFQTLISNKVTLTVGQVLVFDVHLKLGNVHETVYVEAESEPIDTTDAQVSNVVNEHQIKSLPLILRDPFQLILLTGGVNSGGGGFSVNGGRLENNNFRLDGADINDVELPVQGIAAINPDSTQEFRVLTNGYMPEFGRNNGAVVDIVTKRGTNEFHGDVYEFARYALLGARDFFNKAGTHKDGYTRSDFGASLGGPIIKDKTFFFANYEGYRFATTRTNSSIVPMPALLTGQFTFTARDPNNPASAISVPIDVSTPNSPNNSFHLSVDPIVKKIFSLYPVPTVSLGNGFQGELFFPSRDSLNKNNQTIKIDHNFSTTETLAVRYIAGFDKESNPIHSDFLPSLGSISDIGRVQLLSAHLISRLRNNWINEFSGDGNRIRFRVSCGDKDKLDGVFPKDQFGNGSDFVWPDGIAGWGCLSLGDTNSQERASGAYTLSDHMTWVAGRHLTKVGLEFADLYSNNLTDFQSRPTVFFDNFTSFGIPAVRTGVAAADSDPALQDTVWTLFGEVSFQSAAQFFVPSGNRLRTDELNMRAHDFAVFWQDSFKAFPNFSLNYGFRWEFNGIPYDAHKLLSTVTPLELSGPAPITFRNVGEGGLTLYPKDWFALQPRVGLAWDPFKNGKTSIRVGYGVYRSRTFLAIADSTRSNPPLTEALSKAVFEPTSTGFVGTPVSNLPPLATIKPTATVNPLALISPTIVDPNLRLPYNQSWNVGIQRDLPGNLLLEVNYIGVQGKRLFRTVDGNQPIPGLVSQLRAFCAHPNSLNCIDSPNASTVQGANLFEGKELGVLPFDAVNNNAFFHGTVYQASASSNYNALQATITRRFSGGIFVQAAYTWAHEIDDAAAPIGPTANNQGFPADSFDLRREHGNGSEDIRHALVVNYTAELPLGVRKAHLNQGFVGRVLEGWSLSGITSFSGGLPFDILTLRDSNGTAGLALTRADYHPLAKRSAVNNPATQTGPNPGLFSTPPFGRPGNLSRNVFRVPGINNWDAVLAKSTKINESLELEFRTEIYNVFNHVRLSPPDNIVEDPSFGQSTSQVGRNDGTSGARQLQFGLKVNF